jgi:hypothetical protein
MKLYAVTATISSENATLLPSTRAAVAPPAFQQPVALACGLLGIAFLHMAEAADQAGNRKQRRGGLDASGRELLLDQVEIAS